MIKRYSIYVAIFILGVTVGVAGTYAVTSSSTSHPHTNQSRVKLKEAGQGGFAAIQEVVRHLQSRSDVNWGSVDIDALRKHLVDMNELTLKTSVQRQVGDETITFRVRGEGRTIGAIRRMVPRHARMTLDSMETWSAKTETIQNGVSLTVKPSGQARLSRARALGFYGLMALGANHPKHHLMIATGTMDY